jgi:hypothetical protein
VFGADNASANRECLGGISGCGRKNAAGLPGLATAADGGYAALPHKNAASAQIPLDGSFGTI